MLHNETHTCKKLVQDIKKYGIHHFCFIPFYFGAEWDEFNTRLDAEKMLILFNNLIVYNTQHAAKIKQKRKHPRLKKRPNFLNDFPLRFYIEGQFFENLSNVRHTFAPSRREILQLLHDNENFLDWQLVDEILEQFSELQKFI